MTKKTSPKLKEIYKQLDDKDLSVQKKGVKALRMHGDETSIPRLLDLLKNPSGPLYTEAFTVLCQLKNTEARAVLAGSIRKEVYSDRAKEIAAASWQTGYTGSDDLSHFVKAAIQNDYETAMECMTFIEQVEPPFNDAEVSESLLLLNDYFDGEKDDKEPLLRSILAAVKLMYQRV